MNKYDAWIIRSLGVFVPLMTGILFTMLIGMKTDIGHLDDVKAEAINTLSPPQYFAIEVSRSEVAANLFIEFGKMVGLKEEDLDPFGIKATKDLNRPLKTGTTRGG